MTDALRRHRRFLMGLFIAAAAFLYLGHIGSYHLIDLDEGRYHRVAMEMVLSGDYITPHFDYMPYFEKPIFQYWVTALSMELFGIREFTGRILPALTGLVTSSWPSGWPRPCTTGAQGSWLPSSWLRRPCSSSSPLSASWTWP